MDKDDPIQQLLKSTGWSCDDLLQKLQMLKSSNASSSRQETTEQTNINDDLGSTVPNQKSDPKFVINTDSDNLSKPVVQVLPRQKILNKKSLKLNESFLDTDRQKYKVNATNTNTGQEIIEENSETDKSQPALNEASTSEVTEVTVIQINEEEEGEKSEEPEENLVTPEEIEQLSRHSKEKDEANYETITIQTKSQCTNQAVNQEIKYVEIHPRKRVKVQGSRGLYKLFQKKVVTPSHQIKRNNNFRLQNVPTHVSNFLMKKTKQKVDPDKLKKFKMASRQQIADSNRPTELVVSDIPVVPEVALKPSVSSHDKIKSNIRIAPKIISKTYVSSKTDGITEKAGKPAVSNDIEDVLPKSVISSKTSTASTSSIEVVNKSPISNFPIKLTICGDNLPKNTSLFKSTVVTNSISRNVSPVTTSSNVNSTLFKLMNCGGIIDGEKIKKIPLSSPLATPVKKQLYVPESTCLLDNSSVIISNVSQNSTNLCTGKENKEIETTNSEQHVEISTLNTVDNNCSVIHPRVSQNSTDLCSGTEETTNSEQHIETSTLPLQTEDTCSIIPLNILQNSTDLSTEKETTKSEQRLRTPTFLLQTEDSEDEAVNEPASLEAVEDIRNNLKLQLSSLRTKRKTQFLETTSSKVIDNMQCSKKLCLLESIKSSNKNASVTKTALDTKRTTEPSSSIDSREDLYTQTNEFGLVILNVQGGVEIDDIENGNNQPKSGDTDKKTTENQSKPDPNQTEPSLQKYIEDTSSNSVPDTEIVEEKSEKDAGDDLEQMGVFAQIRKIINKQKDPVKLLNSKLKTSFPVEKGASKTDDDKKMDISSISGENSQSSFTIEGTDVEEKSPFVSDSLDEFLTGSSKLNISYQVPKLGAEDGFKNKLIEESPLILKKVKDVREHTDTFKIKLTPKVKAKTVAQKRKLLEKQRKKELRRQKKKQLKELKGKVKEVGKMIKELKMQKQTDNKENKCDQRHISYDSYVLFNDFKIWVNSKTPGQCITRINCTKRSSQTPQTTRRKKLSLLHPIAKSDIKVNYRPGPLSKKQHLQTSGNNAWKTQMLRLPKIYLEVSPKQGQPFCNEVLHRFSSLIGGDLDTNKIEFALSAVKSKNLKNDKESEPICFPLNYFNNAEYALVRRRKQLIEKNEPTSCDIKPIEIESSRDTVSSVIEDLIKYVEIKELSSTLIKEDNTEIKTEDKDITLLSPLKDNVFKKPKAKRTKIECELLRLNCKVVNVQLEDKTEEGDQSCIKPHCQLGCVCKSIKCDYVLPKHCQKIACMFECSCPKEKQPIIYEKLTSSTGTNLLSRDAVTRIEDEAKKDLAKIEREFTQTVIHTSDKTIVVGVGDRTKMRRHAKAPAKFSDFVSSTLAICEEDQYAQRCTVSLPRLNLSQLIPYCLKHNLHDCYCKGLDTLFTQDCANEIENPDESRKVFDYQPKAKKTKYNLKPRKYHKLTTKDVSTVSDELKGSRSETENSSVDENWAPPKYFENDTSNGHNTSVKRSSRISRRRTLSDDFVEYSEQPGVVHSSCSRVKRIAQKYQRVLKYTSEVYQDDFINNLLQSDLFKAKIQQKNPTTHSNDADVLKNELIQEKITSVSNQTNNKSKRKQTLESRSEPTPSVTKQFNHNAALQRRKKSLTQSRKHAEVKPIFDGEIIIDETNMDLLKKMGPKTVAEGYARLLPWPVLIRGYQNMSINIWSMIDQPSRLLINRAEKKCPKNYVNIKDSSEASEVVTWIKNNKLPSHYQEESLSFILKETKDNFEICGICTKNINEKLEENDGFIAETENIENMPDLKDIYYHKDLSGVERSFTLYQMEYNRIELVEENLVKSMSLRVALPPIHNICKWRMIYLNSDFTFLFFNSIPYSIRYTDLLVVCDYAKRHECTVWLKNKEIQKEYEHTMFGIYFDPSFTDRIFIGPYFKSAQSNDVETLRYINQSLVSTESFNLMRGKGDYKCGHWLVKARQTKKIPSHLIPKIAQVKPRKKSITDSTIDLTSDNDDEIIVSEVSKHPPDKQQHYPFAPVIMHNKQEVKIIDAPPRKPEDFNRYIITNIPHFGYLGAFTHPQGEIDVSWPFENKLLRFCTEHSATSFLQGRFSSLLQSIPETFKIHIVVAHKIDLNVYKPIDSAVLSGHYICGDFGYMNVLTTSDEECRTKTGVSKSQIMKLFSKRAQNFVLKKIETLTMLLNIPMNSSGGYNLPVVLTKAAEEIQMQLKKDRANLLYKNALFLKKRENALKLHKMISELPQDLRNAENMKFRSILHMTDPSPIEINDSDDEPNKNDQQNTLESKSSETSIESPNETIEVFKSPSTVPYSNKSKLKSLLKPLVPLPLDEQTHLLIRRELNSTPTKEVAAISSKSSPTHKPQYIKGVKLVKRSGGFVLINDHTKKVDESNGTPKATRVIIKDNQIYSVNNMDNSNANPISVSHFGNMKIDETIIIDLDKDNQTSGDVTEVTIRGNSFRETDDNSEKNIETNTESANSVISLDDSMEKNESDTDDSDVIAVEKEPMIIDLDEFPSDDELGTSGPNQGEKEGKKDVNS